MKMRLFVVPVLCLFASAATAETITVCLDGSCDFDSIQAAIDYASDGDVIEIAAGTYYPSATIRTLGKAVTLRGELGKDEELATVLDGQGSIRVLQCVSGEVAGTIFAHLLITGGYAEDGGGMYIYNSSPMLMNCTFEGNSTADDGGDGGGMFNWGHSSPTLTGCMFEGNSAGDDGGGMYNDDDSTPTLMNCTFEGNSAGDYGGGGGMYNSGSSPTLINCMFESNSAAFGGGMLNDGRSPTLTDCTFTSNSATGSGGGMYNDYYSSPTLTNCTLTNNSALNGGGMYNYTASYPTLTDCTFTSNSATGSGGGMYNDYYSSQTLANCTLTNNSALSGGGMYNYNASYPTLTDTIVCGNTPNQIHGSWTDNGGNTIADECPDSCPADLDGNGSVDGADLTVVLGDWGLTNSPADLNGDGLVDGADLSILLGDWGPCP